VKSQEIDSEELQQELQQASSAITTTSVKLHRRFPGFQTEAKNPRRVKENRGKSKKKTTTNKQNKEKRLQTRALQLVLS